MQSIESYELNPTRPLNLNFLVYVFITLNMLVWTLAPSLVRHTLPMDALEGFTWGQQLEWGYDKNPFMNGWLTALAAHLGGQGMIYFFSQLSVGMCFLATWELGKKFLPPLSVFCAILLLASTQYFNLHAIDFNDNTLELGFWALTILFFYRALQKNNLRDWLITAFFAAASLMTKYFVIVLFVPMVLFMLCDANARQSFFRKELYLALVLFLCLIAPHIIWLFHHDFITVQYAFNRVDSVPSVWNHIFYPAQFAWQQIEVFLPALLLAAFLCIGKNSATFHVSSYDRKFLWIMGAGPFFLTVLLSLIAGIKLRAGWGQPLLTLWPLILFALIRPTITPARLQRFFSLFVIVFVGTVIIYCLSLIQAKDPSSANFPGEKIAETLETKWVNTYHVPLNYVVGPRWVASNIAFYSNAHPKVYIDGDKNLSPWISEKTLKQRGAIFIWDPTETFQMSEKEMKNRFPKLGPIEVMHFTWARNQLMTPVEMKVAFLAPE